MKTLYLVIVAVAIFVTVLIIIIEFPIYHGPSALIIGSRPYQENVDGQGVTNSSAIPPQVIPASTGIMLHFNDTKSWGDMFYLKQGQNVTLIVSATSDPTDLPIILYAEPHIGFTSTNGLDFKFSSTHLTTPGTVLLYISVGKDATPNAYKTTVFATTEGGPDNMTMGGDIGITVTPQDNSIQKLQNTTIVLNGTTSGPGSISSTTDILFGIGFDQIIHVNQYATGNYDFVLKPGSLGIIGMKYHSLNACNGMWQNNICLTSQQQNISSNYVISSYPTKADVYTMPPDSSFIGNGSAVGIIITEQWKPIDNFTSFVNYTINTTPQANGTYDIILRDSGPGQFLTIGTIPYNGTFPSVSIY
ncbi:MAG: hypothetical protein ACREAR_04490 [Nitrosotalea sp.]